MLGCKRQARPSFSAMASPKPGTFQSENTCSVCLELVNDTRERSIAKLICGHQFHLDCIGSAFNAKGSMQCPNCRHIENGNWLYGNGRPHLENLMPEDMMLEEEYDVELDMFTRVSEFFFADGVLQFHHSPWCPYEGSYPQLSSSLGNGERPAIGYTEMVVDVLLGEHLEGSESVQPQAPALGRRPPRVEQNVGVQDSSAHMQHLASYSQPFTPTGRRGHHTQATGVVAGIGLHEGAGWSQVGTQLAGHSQPSQSRHNGRRRRSNASTPAVAYTPANQLAPRPASWGYPGISAAQDALGDVQPRNRTNLRQRRREGRSRLWQFLSEAQLQRLMQAPTPPYASNGAAGTLASELPMQVGIADQHVQATSQAHPLYPAEDVDVQSSRSFYRPR